jgi:hypothetical protein
MAIIYLNFRQNAQTYEEMGPLSPSLAGGCTAKHASWAPASL